MEKPSEKAWNNFVMYSDPSDHVLKSEYRAAAIASQYMALANNGGINSYLTSTSELGGCETVQALECLGAGRAAKELDFVLQQLDVVLTPSSQEERWRVLDVYWPETLGELDLLSSEANTELLAKLALHVMEHEAFYLNLK